MRKGILILIGLLITVSAYAGNRVERVFNAAAVQGTASTTTSRVLNVGSARTFGYWFDADKADTPEPFALKIVAEGSPTNADGSYATMSTLIASYDDSSYTAVSIPQAGTVDPAPATKYMRIVAEGIDTNATGTTLTGYIFVGNE